MTGLRRLAFLVPAACLLAAGTARAQATGNAEAGEKVFHQCQACHSDKPGVNRVGPTLYGVVGRKAGSVPGYHYSNAMKSANFVWTPEKLNAYLTNPQKVVPGNKMPFPGLKSAQQRKDVIAFLEKNAQKK